MVDSTVGGRYRIERVLGSGGSGQVCLAQDLTLGRPVALKFVHSHLNSIEPSAVQRLQREALILSQLQHPNIVQVYSISLTEDQKLYLCMEYIPGRSLQEHLRDGPLPLKASLAIAEQLCEAMVCAQQRQVVHRDIKPGNVLVVESEAGELRVKLADFGLSKLPESVAGAAALTRTNALVGTLQYMSPEQCVGRAADSRSDVYSFGCTLFEAIFGEPPFVSQSPAELIRMHISQPLPKVLSESRFNGCPVELKSILVRCLQKQPDKRYQSFAELLKDLQRLRSLPAVQNSGAISLGEVAALDTKQRLRLPLKVVAVIVGLLSVATMGLLLLGNDGRAIMTIADYMGDRSRTVNVRRLVQSVERLCGPEQALRLSVATISTPQFQSWPPEQQAELSEFYLKHFLGQKLPGESAHLKFQISRRLLLLELDKMDATTFSNQPLSAADSRRLQLSINYLLHAPLTALEWGALLGPLVEHDACINRGGTPRVVLDDNWKMFSELVAETLVHNKATEQREVQTIMVRYLGAGQGARLSRQWPEVARLAARALQISQAYPNPDCELMARVLLAECAIQKWKMKEAADQLAVCRKLRDTWELWPYTKIELQAAEDTYKRALTTGNRDIDTSAFFSPSAVPRDSQPGIGK